MNNARIITPEALLAETAWLRELVRSLLRDEASVDDVCQDTLLATWQRPGLRGNVRAWLARVARSKIMRLHVGASRRRRREQLAAQPEAQPSADQSLQQFQLQLQLARELDALGEPYRTAILLRFWEDLPPREVARRTGAAVETVRTRIKRGLALLRERLDARCGNRAAWSLPLGAWSLAAAPASSGMFWLGGWWMSSKFKLLLGAGLALFGAIAAWPLVFPSAAPLAVAAAPQPSVQAPVDVAAEPNIRTAPEPKAEAARTELVPTPDVPDDEPVLVAPFDLVVRTVDGDGHAVADATIQFWLAHRVSKGDHGNGYQGRLAGKEPYRTVHTDARGEITLRIDREVLYARAQKDGVGASSDVMMGSLRHAQGEVLLLTLAPQVLLHGEVKSYDNSPVSTPIALEVRKVLRSAWMPGEQRWNENSVISDAAGHFTVHLDVGHVFALVAVQGKDHSFETLVDASSPGEQSALLTFPGRFGIRGFVLDEQGNAVQATVWVREKRVDTMEYKSVYEGHRGLATTDGHGSFLAFVPHAGAYEVLAKAPGHAASNQDEVLVQEGAAAPRVTLRLLAVGAIHGSVVSAAGAPVPDARLRLIADTDPALQSPWSVSAGERYGTFEARSAADGTFAFEQVHPLAGYRLECAPDPQRPASRLKPQVVHANSAPVVLVVPAEGVHAKITGVVTDAATGQPVPKFSVRIVTTNEDGSLGVSYEHRFEDAQGRYTLEEVPFGKKCQLIARATGFAGAGVDVPEAGKPELNLPIALPRPGQLSVTVLDAQGLPIEGAQVFAAAREALADGMLNFYSQPPTDAHGHVELLHLDPGIYDVRVAARDKQKGEQKDVFVASGSTGAITIQVR